tara:strand:+ start:3673 stop:4266 length:594 start_codon:yes stop_codon:yes gene_type:complete
MKRIIFILILIFSTPLNSEEKIISLANVNNISITNKDLNDEMLFVQAVNSTKQIDKKKLQQTSFQNLIEEAVKEIELRMNKFEIDQKLNNQAYIELKKKLNEGGINSSRMDAKIKKKIQLDYAWNLFISRKYGRKLNINIDEIDQKLVSLGYVDPNNPETTKAKRRMINQEKNRKFSFYSRSHLDQTKRELLINIIK